MFGVVGAFEYVQLPAAELTIANVHKTARGTNMGQEKDWTSFTTDL